MARLVIEAYCLDTEFRHYLASRGIEIVDEANAPWEVEFQGARAALREALIERWVHLDTDPDSLIEGD